MKTTIIILLSAIFMMACDQKGNEKAMDSNNNEMQGTGEEENLWPNHESVSALSDKTHQQNVEIDKLKSDILEKLQIIQPWYTELRASRISYNSDREGRKWFLYDKDVLPYMNDTVLFNLRKDSSAILTASYKNKILKRGESLNEPFNLTLLMTGNKNSAELNGDFDIYNSGRAFMTHVGREQELLAEYEGDDTPAPRLPREEELDIYKQMIKIDRSGKKATHIIPYEYLAGRYYSKALKNNYVVFEFVREKDKWLVDDIYIAPSKEN